MTSMSENLADMVKKTISAGQEDKKDEVKIITPETKAKQDDKSKPDKLKETKEQKSDTIPVSNLIDWFPTHYKALQPSVKQVKLAIGGVDPKDTLIFTLPHPRGGKASDGLDKRKVYTFDNADKRSVIDLNPIALNAYNNETFRIIYHYKDNIYLKAYGVKTGLYVTFCVEIESLPIPYKVVRIKKREKGIKFEAYDFDKIYKILNQPADNEGLLILYPQLMKLDKEITTVKSAMEVFLNIQKEVVDITHHLKLDFIMADMLK